MTKFIDVTLSDPREEGNIYFSNMVDPMNINILIERIKDTDEKRSLSDLVFEFLQGR